MTEGGDIKGGVDTGEEERRRGVGGGEGMGTEEGAAKADEKKPGK